MTTQACRGNALKVDDRREGQDAKRFQAFDAC
jgi:hypothetical protein